MGCGCGGSTRSAEQVPRDQIRRPAAERGAQTRAQDPGGFVWRGPRRNPKPEQSPRA